MFYVNIFCISRITRLMIHMKKYFVSSYSILVLVYILFYFIHILSLSIILIFCGLYKELMYG